MLFPGIGDLKRMTPFLVGLLDSGGHMGTSDHHRVAGWGQTLGLVDMLNTGVL